MKKKNKTFLHNQPAIIAVVSFIFLVVGTVSYTNYKQGLWEKDIRADLLDVLISKKSKLEKALYSRIYYTRGVAAFVALKPDITNEEFTELAKEYIKNDTVISTMALSKNCILNAIYPLKGHEAALGLDLLTHPERKEIVEKTIETHETFVAGPVELVEGGIAFISYTPIFDRLSPGKNKFWGVTDIVIKQHSLFDEAQFTSQESGFRFALRGYNGLGKDGAIFWGRQEIFDKDPVTIHIDLPIGTWVLAGIPINGWNEYPDQDKTITLILFISSLIISVLIWLFSRALLKIKQNEKELKAIFGSMDNLIVEYNRKGEYVKIAPTNDSILFKTQEELIGKSVHEIFDPEKAGLFLHAIHECLDTKKLVVIEYPLDINGNERWFSARINFKTADTVIFNAYDISEKKKDEQTIEQSAIQLKELNEMKDKFFSIIAHDLRNPVGGMKALTDLILDDFESMESDQLKELIQTLQLSSTNLHLLLEDLLQWSLSQSGNFIVKKQLIGLKSLCNDVITLLQSDAQRKNINLVNQTGQNTIVFGDNDLTRAILRNLISNAIKFTDRGGEIRVYSEEFEKDRKQFQRISVADNGIGIKTEKVATIFQIDKTRSTPGTENEKGTGLGLLLCKELVEKQGGQISVCSTYGEGSTFSFTLPAGDGLN